jgi:hypothetical protein
MAIAAGRPGILGQNHPPPTLPRRRPAANNALYRIALVRMSAHQQSRDYVARQHGNGRTKKEMLRLLKRAIAREIFRLLTRPAQSTTTVTCGLPDKLKTSP